MCFFLLLHYLTELSQNLLNCPSQMSLTLPFLLVPYPAQLPPESFSISATAIFLKCVTKTLPQLKILHRLFKVKMLVEIHWWERPSWRSLYSLFSKPLQHDRATLSTSATPVGCQTVPTPTLCLLTRPPHT